MHVAQAKRLDEIRDVLDDCGHRVVLYSSRVVGIALAEAVEGEHPSKLGDALEVPAPIGSAIGAQIRAEIAAVQEHNRLAFALLKVAGADAAHIDKLFIAQRHYTRPPRLDRA